MPIHIRGMVFLASESLITDPSPWSELSHSATTAASTDDEDVTFSAEKMSGRPVGTRSFQ